MIEVTLTENEMFHYGLLGFHRNLESILTGRTPRFGERYFGEMYSAHIVGMQAEAAVAKALGKYVEFHSEKFSAGDVGEWEVRWSLMRKLKLRDRDNGPVICVTGKPPHFRIMGWIHADDGRKEEFLDDPGERNAPAYFVPWTALRPLDELVAKNA